MPQSRQLAAIMFTDLVGYTSLMGEDEERAFDLLQKNRELQRPLLEKHNGRFLKEIGDGILASFSSASDAVYCALEIQKESQKYSDVSLRIGVHLGDVVFQKDDVFGDGVNIASRIQGLASPGVVLVSESVYQNISNKKGIAAEFIGKKQLKGVNEPVGVYEVKLQSSERPIPSDHQKQVTNPTIEARSKKSIWFVTALLLAVIGYLIFNKSKGGEPDDYVVLKNSIAVLPFADMSAEQDQEYLGDGIAEELISSFAKSKDLKVIARTSSFQFKGKNIDVREVGSKLNVNYIVEGSVRKYEDQLRITVQLIDAGDGSHIWSEDYDRSFDEIFSMQSQIAHTVFDKISASLNLLPVRSSPGTTNAEAYQNYIKAVYRHRKLWEKYEFEDIDEIEELLKQTISLDPNFAEAHAELSNLYDTRYQLYLNDLHPNDSIYKHKAMIQADIAYKLNPESCLANISQGLSYFRRNKQKEAFNSFLQAIDHGPEETYAYEQLAGVLHNLGLHRESMSLMEKALEIDPINSGNWEQFAWLNYHVGRFNVAKEAFNEAYKLDGKKLGLTWIAILTGDLETAERYMPDSSDQENATFYEPFLMALKGDTNAIQAAEKSSIRTTPTIWLLLIRSNMKWTPIEDWSDSDYFNKLEQVQSDPNKCCNETVSYHNDHDFQSDESFISLIQPLLNEPFYLSFIDAFSKCQAQNRKKYNSELEKLKSLLNK